MHGFAMPMDTLLKTAQKFKQNNFFKATGKSTIKEGIKVQNGLEQKKEFPAKKANSKSISGGSTFFKH
jgi:hypothetical protein